jgi:hypothetical protein
MNETLRQDSTPSNNACAIKELNVIKVVYSNALRRADYATLSTIAARCRRGPGMGGQDGLRADADVR